MSSTDHRLKDDEREKVQACKWKKQVRCSLCKKWIDYDQNKAVTDHECESCHKSRYAIPEIAPRNNEEPVRIVEPAQTSPHPRHAHWSSPSSRWRSGDGCDLTKMVREQSMREALGGVDREQSSSEVIGSAKSLLVLEPAPELMGPISSVPLRGHWSLGLWYDREKSSHYDDHLVWRSGGPVKESSLIAGPGHSSSEMLHFAERAEQVSYAIPRSYGSAKKAKVQASHSKEQALTTSAANTFSSSQGVQQPFPDDHVIANADERKEKGKKHVTFSDE